jgi:uncharacterized repeat protein (TIGR03803 family)
MNSNKFWTVVSSTVAAVTMTLITILLLAPGAWAASGYNILYSFTGGTDGSQPTAVPIFDAAGNLYGTTRYDGAYGYGNVFELTPNLDGTWTFAVLYSFTGGKDGANPWASLIFDSIGNLYGTTCNGGAHGHGTVFKLTPNSDGTWTESVLHGFAGRRDGAHPWSGLTFDASGNLYGETTQGGNSSNCRGGCGVVFKLTPHSGGKWTESVIHRFTGEDGSDPQWGSLTFDAAGKLYGTTTAFYHGGPCCGTVFELIPKQNGSWKEKVLYHFTDGNDGGSPQGAPVFDSAGNLYGSAEGPGYGLVFELTRGANGKWNEQVLYTFQGDEDGASPQDGVILDSAGNLYGTTFYGRPSGGGCACGQVYELSPDGHGGWSKQVLHYFEGPPADGGNTNAGVAFDTAGNLYGTTCDGGAGGGNGCASSGAGVVFEITP